MPINNNPVLVPDPFPTCPFCGTLDDWHEQHEHRDDCGACGAIRHRCDERSPWEYVSPKTLRSVRRAEAMVPDKCFDHDGPGDS